jgi:hypothetical protein
LYHLFRLQGKHAQQASSVANSNKQAPLPMKWGRRYVVEKLADFHCRNPKSEKKACVRVAEPLEKDN